LLVSVLLLSATFAQAAAPPTYEAARHEAFARGGTAITQALNYKEDAKASTPRAVEESDPATPPAPVPPQAATDNTRRHMPAWQYGALAGAFTVMGILLYHWATGPGASIRNCSTCSK
jgi:hypothetical protein